MLDGTIASDPSGEGERRKQMGVPEFIEVTQIAILQAADDLGLVGLPDLLEPLDGLRPISDVARDHVLLLRDLLHLALDLLEVFRRERSRERDVVEEAVRIAVAETCRFYTSYASSTLP